MQSRRGFSLVEAMISLTLLGVVLTSIFGVVVQTQRDYTRQRENIRGQENMRVADVFIRTVLRSGLADPRVTGGTLIDADPLNTNNWDNIRVKSDITGPAGVPDGNFDYPLEDVQMYVNADSLMVQLQAGAGFGVYAYPVRAVKFEYYRHDGVQITNEANVSSTRRIKYTLVAPPNPIVKDTIKRTTWVYMRNRR